MISFMKNKKEQNKKGFTLIELLSVIVILGVLMLIAIPSVTRYIDKSKKITYIKTISSIVDTVRYEVNSGDSKYSMEGVNERKFFFKDIETEKGKNSNLYGYVKVVKKTDEDGYIYRVFLSGSDDRSNSYCSNQLNIANLSTNNIEKCVGEDYKYVIGDTITYKGSKWYVIKNSPVSGEDYVVLMKGKVLTNVELGDYAYQYTCTSNAVLQGVCTTAGETVNTDTMEYTWTETCHNANHGYSEGQYDCDNTNSYASSKVKEAVEAYATSKGMMNDLDTVDGYKIRLLKYDELEDNLGYANTQICTGSCFNAFGKTENTPAFVYSSFGENQNSVYGYWTMTPHADYSSDVWRVTSDGDVNYFYVSYSYSGVRPVINLLKSAIPAQS